MRDGQVEKKLEKCIFSTAKIAFTPLQPLYRAARDLSAKCTHLATLHLGGRSHLCKYFRWYNISVNIKKIKLKMKKNPILDAIWANFRVLGSI